jgi:4-hydroxy-tetrahydrodipicolinate reductase
VSHASVASGDVLGAAAPGTLSRPVRAVVYGVGAMGSIMTRLLVEKGAEVVGAVSRSSAKVGRDLGEVAGMNLELGVIVSDDPIEVMAQADADVAVVAVASYLEVMYDHFAVCLSHGVNVVTIEEECFFPWATAPVLAQRLDALAKRHGATIMGSGAQDAYWMTLPSVLIGVAHRVESLRGRTRWNVDDYGPEVAEHVHAGSTLALFEAHVDRHGWPSFVVRNTVDALVADAGLTPANVEATVTPVIAQAPTPSRVLGRTIEPGGLLGVTDAATIITAEGPSFTFEQTGCVYGSGQSDVNEWIAHGEPELHLRNDEVPTRLATCTQVVNRIPDVINAPPGLVTVSELPRLRYRHFPLHRYVRALPERPRRQTKR